MREEWLELHAVETCPECKGAKYVQHHRWAAFWQEENARELFSDDERLERWFLGRFGRYSERHILPPEEVPCYNCEAQGVTRSTERLSLAELAARLEVTPKNEEP